MTTTNISTFTTPGDATRAAELKRVKLQATLVLAGTLAQGRNIGQDGRGAAGDFVGGGLHFSAFLLPPETVPHAPTSRAPTSRLAAVT